MIRKLPFLHRFLNKNTQESGRSMVEILGVLAVIGVLSAGGIYGYSYAMDKYRANDIIYEVNLRNRDTWNKYQDKDLPEADELDEWAEVTQTGFPIGVYPRSNIVFDVQVDDVPSRVCKQVLNMNIEGPMFIWTPAEDGKKQIFNGNASELCGDDIETSIVFTTSLDSYGQDEGLRQGATDENGRPIRYCLDDDDCFSCQTCDVGTYTCQSTCPDATPICHSTLQQCVACEDNSDCANNQICSEYNEETGESQVCVTVEETCAEGEFRSQNGACIPCDYPANVLIKSDETFMNDTGTGKELCLACPNSRRVEGNSEKIYCSIICTSGISFADTSTTCHMCTDNPDKSFLVNTDIEKSKCLACSSQHYWVGYVYDQRICTNIRSCAPNEYYYPVPASGSVCQPCDHSIEPHMISYVHSSSSEMVALRKSSCEACPDTPTTKRWWIQYGVTQDHTACFPVCQQPSDVTDCDNPDTCTRQFQGVDAKCYACSVTTSVDIGYDTALHDLCEKCGREVNDTKCVKKAICTDTQFRGIDGKCYDCTEPKVVQVLDEADSGCEKKCAGVVINDTTGNHTGRELLKGYHNTSYNININVCRPKCNEYDANGNKMFQDLGRTCYKCSTDYSIEMVWKTGYGGANVTSFAMKKAKYNDIECNSCNVEGQTPMRISGDRLCTKYEACDNGFRDKEGNCKQCNDPVAYNSVSETECYRNCKSQRIAYIAMNPAGNQMIPYCIHVNPGVSGVCNDIGNSHHPAYDDSANKMFRDITGNCKSCNIPDTITVGKNNYHNNTFAKQQCAHCGNRNYNGNFYCSYGLCDGGVTFANIDFECISCTTTTARTEIPLGVATEDNCTSCDGKRVMKTGSTDDKNLKAYCVKKCVVGEFQKTDGKCYTGSNDYGTIGSDEQSKTLCRESGRIAFSKQNNGVTDWYCSQTATETEHFINLSGQRVSCTANDTEIPNSQDARNLCTQCSDRYIETTGDKITCRKG